MTAQKKRFLEAQDAVMQAMSKLTDAGMDLSDEEDPVASKGYPFPESLDKTFGQILRWREATKTTAEAMDNE
ncbi:hypothetical protein J2T17_007476 [Paenibacillus mucilaginosus]|uniref:hypothetical protein n=1 Tax=Paenibacillus mucilaginosus TaxID=61624 RepID=UPI003D20ABDB